MPLSSRPRAAIVSAGLISVLCAAGAARAERFVPVGVRHQAMGGAGVAASEDATSIYWNPANLGLLPLHRPPFPKEKQAVEDATKEAREAMGTQSPGLSEDEEPVRDKEHKWEGYDTIQVVLPVAGAELKLTGDIVARLNDLDEFVTRTNLPGVADRVSSNPTSVTVADFQNFITFYEGVENLDEGGDAIAEIVASLFFRYKYLGIGVNTISYASVHPRVETTGGVAFSDTVETNAIIDFVQAQPGGAPASPTTQAGLNFQAQLQAAIPTLAPDNAATLAALAEQSGVNLNDPVLTAALTAAAQQSGSGGVGDIRGNQSGGDSVGVSVQELAISVGFDFGTEIISLGIAPKLMSAFTARETVTVADVLVNKKSFDDIAKDFFESKEQTITFGVDVGASLQPVNWLRLSVLGRNLNEPTFDFKAGGEFKLKRQVRAGVAVRPVPSIEIAADIDVLVNEFDKLPGLKSRQVGGGIEWAPQWSHFGFALRGGVRADLEDRPGGEKETRPVLTAGLGFRIAAFTLDLGGAVALKREEFRDQEIPTEAGFGIQLGLTF